MTAVAGQTADLTVLIRNKDKIGLAAMLERDDIDINRPGSFGTTPLTEAIVQGDHFAFTRLMLKDAIDPLAPDKSGLSPLVQASQYGRMGMHHMLICFINCTRRR